MNILLVGCGRSGRHLAEILIRAGQDLILIDEDAGKLAAMEDLNTVRIKGKAIDIDVLEEAGIRNASAVIAIDDDENTNIMCCQIARELYGIKHVIARTYSPENEEFVHSLGIATICSTDLTVNRALQALGFEEK